MTQHTISYPTVLLVEDDEDTRSMLRRGLEVFGYRVTEAVNGREAIELASSKCPDLILMDLGLPVVDGFAAARN